MIYIRGFDEIYHFLHRPAGLDPIPSDQFIPAVAFQYDVWCLVISQNHVPAFHTSDSDSGLLELVLVSHGGLLNKMV